jgi:hypothetical protein
LQPLVDMMSWTATFWTKAITSALIATRDLAVIVDLHTMSDQKKKSS